MLGLNIVIFAKIYQHYTMYRTPNEISVERLLEQDIPYLIGFHKDIVMMSNFGDMSLFAHPVRLKATTVLICLKGVIDCNINLRNYLVTENHMIVTFAGDIIQINRAEDVSGYAIILSEEYLQQIQLDFRFRADLCSVRRIVLSETILYSVEKEYGGWKYGSDKRSGSGSLAYDNSDDEAVSAFRYP